MPDKLTPGGARLQQLNELLDAALSLPAQERANWLKDLPEHCQPLRPTLSRLLARAELETDDFLRRPVDQLDMALEHDADEASPGDEVGPYRLIRRLGRGGMAVVWLAERTQGVARQVALKLPAIGWVGGLSRRIARERDILASLEHPNIARLYEAGETAQGRPWLAMEFVQGEPLDAYLKRHQPGLRERLALFLELADAVAYAHSRMVVHRDLKPGNILVTPEGRPKLLDFGVAKLLMDDDAADGLTRQVGLGVTPDFAAPEQLDAGLVTAASDVYALGIVLFEMLTEVRPYTLGHHIGTDLGARLKTLQVPLPSRVAAGRPRLAKALRGDLDNIIGMATRKEPERRYSSAEGFAADVRRHLEDRPVLARSPDWRYLAAKFVGRNRTALGMLSAVVISLAVGLVVAVQQWRQADAQRLFALDHMMRSEATGDFVNTVLMDSAGRDRPVTVRELLEGSERYVLAARNPVSLAMSTETLASWKIQLGDVVSGERLLSRALESISRGQYPLLWQRLACLRANALSQMARPAEAKALLEHVFSDLAQDSDTRSYCLLQRSYVASRGAHGAAQMERDALQALILLDGAGPGFARRRALLNGELADAYSMQGRVKEADERFAQAHAQLQSIDKAESLNGMSVLGNWAGMHLRAGSPRRALDMYLQAKEVAERLGEGRRAPPVLLVQIANSMRQVGRATEAVAGYRDAAAAARAVGSSRVEAFALIGLALSALEAGQPGAEVDHALERSKSLIGADASDPRHPAGGSWLLAQALLWHERRETARALALLDSALQTLSGQDSPGVARVNTLIVRGGIRSSARQDDDAQRDLEEALAQARKLPALGAPSSFVGRAALALSEHHARAGQIEAARRHALQALQALTPSVGEDSGWVERARRLAGAPGRS